MQPIRLAIVALAALSITGCISVRVDNLEVDADDDSRFSRTGFINMTTEVDGKSRPAVLFVPADYDPSEEYPLIVFLHGAGERGDDGLRQTQVGIGKAIRENPERFPCLVFMPQCPSGQWWSEVPGRGGDNSGHEHISDGIDSIMARYNIDEDRVTLTGLSMGGYGTFSYGADQPEHFAAFMPICGGGDEANAANLAKRPMWVFHGDADTVVPLERSQVMVDAIKAAGGDVKFTVYPGVGHNSWDDAYSRREKAVEWLLAQER